MSTITIVLHVLVATCIDCPKPIVADVDEGMRDRTLISAIRKCLSEGADPINIEIRVGRRATLNTSRKTGPDELRALRLEIDPDAALPQVLDLVEMKHVVLWTRPGTNQIPRVVGVCWNENGRSTLFFAIVPSP